MATGWHQGASVCHWDNWTLVPWTQQKKLQGNHRVARPRHLGEKRVPVPRAALEKVRWGGCPYAQTCFSPCRPTCPTPLVLFSAPHLVETAPGPGGADLSPSRLIRTQEQATGLVHLPASPVPSTSCNSRPLLGSQEFLGEVAGNSGPLLSSLSVTASASCAAPRLETRPEPGPCQPLGAAPETLSWKPEASVESGSLGPAHQGSTAIGEWG